jgi:hypothetical protein
MHKHPLKLLTTSESFCCAAVIEPHMNELWSALFSGHALECRGSGICPRQQIVDLAVGMAIDDLGDPEQASRR